MMLSHPTGWWEASSYWLFKNQGNGYVSFESFGIISEMYKLYYITNNIFNWYICLKDIFTCEKLPTYNGF